MPPPLLFADVPEVFAPGDVNDDCIDELPVFARVAAFPFGISLGGSLLTDVIVGGGLTHFQAFFFQLAPAGAFNLTVEIVPCDPQTFAHYADTVVGDPFFLPGGATVTPLQSWFNFGCNSNIPISQALGMLAFRFFIVENGFADTSGQCLVSGTAPMSRGIIVGANG